MKDATSCWSDEGHQDQTRAGSDADGKSSCGHGLCRSPTPAARLTRDRRAAAAQAAFETTREAEPSQRSYGYFFCMSGPNSAKASAAYARTRQRVIEEGDFVMIHANTCADGYWTDLTRTYIAGNLQRQRDMRTAIAKHARRGCAPFVPERGPRWIMLRDGHGIPWLGKAFKHAAGHGVDLRRQTRMAGRESTHFRRMCSKRA